jgi:hypothetical protein
MPVATTDAFRRITVQPDNVTVVAEQVGDTLTLVAGAGISLVANTSSDQITIVNTGSGVGGGTVTNYIENPYSFNVAGDDSSTKKINNGETIKFIGSSNVTTSTDTEGNVTITGPNLSSYAATNQTFYLGTTQIAINRTTASQSLTGINIDGSSGSATKSTNLAGGNSTTLLGAIGYQSNTDTTTLLSPNTTTTKKFLRQTGDGTNGAIPAWDTVTATDVGLGNVTNESKATMFSSPTFTGTVAGVTATHVGLGNVTNESKATMFTTPTFTGTKTAISSTTATSSSTTGALTVAGGVGIAGDLFVGGAIAGYASLSSPIFEGTVQMESATFTGTVTMQQSVEKFVTASVVAGAVALNFTQAAIFVVTPDISNFTADFSNIPGTAGRTISTTLIITQGATPYIPNAVKINGGGSVTPKWQGGSAPSGVANRVNIVSFTFVCTATNTWTVIGSLVDYN